MVKSKHANKGMQFEKQIEVANEFYGQKGVAFIQKVATPWQVIRGKAGKIVNAFPLKKSTVDFMGVKNGTYVAFEAKETSEKTRFPLDKIEPHQYETMKQINKQGGLVFLLVHFKKHGEVYRVPFGSLHHWYEIQDDRKSIPYDVFSNSNWIVEETPLFLDYLRWNDEKRISQKG